MTTWGGAYHWPNDSFISVAEAINLREQGRLESGDCWCCKDCYISMPRQGVRLFPRNMRPTPHFWVGPGASYSLNECNGYSRQLSRKESFRYTLFYRDLQTWLNTEAAREQLDFSTFHELQGNKYSDFILDIQNEISGFSRLELLVLHKNRKRSPETDCSIVIDISQWRESDLANFEEFGVRKISDEYAQLIARLGDRKEFIENGTMESRREIIAKSFQSLLSELTVRNIFKIAGRPIPLGFLERSEDIVGQRLERARNDCEPTLKRAMATTVEDGEFYLEQIEQFQTYLVKLKSLGSQDFAHYENFDQIRGAWLGIKEELEITFLNVIHHRYRVNQHNRYLIKRSYKPAPVYENVKFTSGVEIFLPGLPGSLETVNVLKSKQHELLNECYAINRNGIQLFEEFIEMLPLHDAFCEQVSKLWNQTGRVDNKFAELRELLSKYEPQEDHFTFIDNLKKQYIEELKKANKEKRWATHRHKDPATGEEYPDSIRPMPRIEFIAMDYEF